MGRSNLEFVQNKAPKVVQNAEFLLRMAEVLIFNAATMCFDPVNDSAFDALTVQETATTWVISLLRLSVGPRP